MNFLRDLFGKKDENSEKDDQARLQSKVKTYTWSIIPGQYLRSSRGPINGFLVTGKDGNWEDSQTVDEIEGSKILIVHPDHKEGLLDKAGIRSRVVYMTAKDNVLEVLVAMKKIEKSRRADGLAVIVSSLPDFLLRQVYLLEGNDSESTKE